ncbi:MAG: hypothetical protein V4481_05105 [Patescibacteria group bacterium]
MAKKEKKPVIGESKGNKPDKDVEKRLRAKKTTPTFQPNSTDNVVSKYVEKRTNEMIKFRQQLKVEGRWREADNEYVPHELDFGTTRKRFETDQDTGLRSRMVPVGDITQQWRSATSASTLLDKIQTAIGMIVDQMPEAELVPLLKRYEKTTDVAYALWKRNWQISGSKDKLKITVFNLFKYGWAAQRTYPHKYVIEKRVRTTVDTENPENDTFENREIERYNDVDVQPLDVFRTWLDEMTLPYQPDSMKECYHEVDMDYDTFMTEYGDYPNSKFVPPNSYMARSNEESKVKIGGTIRDDTNSDLKDRSDIVTVGFFESVRKDLFVIYIPKWKIPVYTSPLPNDEGYLSITHTMYILRTAKLPYGVSIWEIIRQNKALYDKFKNCTMDQLLLSIMKSFFYTGTNMNLGDGKIKVVPGEGRQITSSTGKPEIIWNEVPGPGEESWKGMEALSSMMDDETGITPTLEGEITGKTLGEIQLAREAALHRQKTPVDNIAWLIEQDAYLRLSWMSQLYTIPTIKEFTNTQELMDFEKESEMSHSELFQAAPTEDDPAPKLTATYLPQLSLHLEDSDGNLVAGKESKFYQLGHKKDQIHPKKLKWRGIFKVLPRSIIDSSQTLERATKMELANVLIPVLGSPLPNGMQLYAKIARQMVKIVEQDEEDWLPDSWIDFLKNGPQAQPAGPGGPLVAPQPGGAPPQGGQPQGGETMQGAQGMGQQQAPTVVPRGQVSGATPPSMGKVGGIFQKPL